MVNQSSVILDQHCGIAAKYEKIRDLSSGAFGFVQQARNKLTNEIVAIKYMARGDNINRDVESEIFNHRQLWHPHVVEFKEVFVTQEHICIVMEYASMGALFEYVAERGHLDESVARWFFQQLIVGLEFCHRKGIVNRDMKLENTLLQAGPTELPLIKICDFGYSKAESLSAPKSFVGTLTYMAPEILAYTGSGYDGKKVDVWSCGIILFAMLYGCFPFDPSDDNISYGQRVMLIMANISRLDMLAPSSIHVSLECTDLLRKLLVADPKQRLSVHEIMQHPWYLAKLPPGALSMNDKVVALLRPACRQTSEEIRAVIEEARTTSMSSVGSNANGFMDDSDDEVFDW